MRSAARGLVCATLVLMVACDGGLAIRQAEPMLKGVAPIKQQVSVRVRASHHLIGENWYYPEVQITNSSGSSITITSVELAARRETYVNEPRQPGIYPLVIPSGSTLTLDVQFQFGDGVGKVLQHSAELRVLYRRGAKDEVANATIVGGPQDARTR